MQSNNKTIQSFNKIPTSSIKSFKNENITQTTINNNNYSNHNNHIFNNHNLNNNTYFNNNSSSTSSTVTPIPPSVFNNRINNNINNSNNNNNIPQPISNTLPNLQPTFADNRNHASNVNNIQHNGYNPNMSRGLYLFMSSL